MDPGRLVWLRRLGPWALVMTALVGVGTLAYHLIEGWRPLDALFMSVITLTTIGYGETHPLSDAGRVFTIVYIVTGLGVATRGLSELARYVAEGAFVEDVRARRVRREIQRMRDHYVVVGYGRLGREIVADLVHHGVTVVVVDTEAPAVTPTGVTVFVGDATLDETLRATGIEHARALAIATPIDAVNVYITLSARQLSPRLFIATRCEDDSAVEKAKRAGANAVLMPYHLGGARMAQAMIRPGAARFVEHATQRHFDDLVLEDVPVTADSGLVGRLVDLDLRGRYGVTVVAVHRRGQERLVPSDADTVLEEGDTLVVVGEPGRVAALLADQGEA